MELSGLNDFTKLREDCIQSLIDENLSAVRTNDEFSFNLKVKLCSSLHAPTGFL